MATLIPFQPSVGRYRFVTVIEGNQYVFHVRWNSRDEAWYFDVCAFDDTPIVQGIKVVLGVNFGRWSNDPLFLDGNMFALSTGSTPHADATFDNLGTTIQVYYYTRADIAANMLASISPAD
jgi:hypothetical protein